MSMHRDLVMPVTTLALHDIIYKIGKTIDGLVCSLLTYYTRQAFYLLWLPKEYHKLKVRR